MSASKLILDVAFRAVIVAPDGSVLILQEATENEGRTQPGKYEVPGGRLEAGETPDEALRREVMEECGLKVTIGDPLHVDEWRPMIRGEQHQIVGIYRLCHTDSKQVTLSDEHDAYAWIDPSEAENYALLPEELLAIQKYRLKI